MSTWERCDSESDEDYCTVVHRGSLIPAIRKAAHGKDFATLSTLMKQFVDAMVHQSCNCGFPEPGNVFKMLWRGFGILNPQVYQIAFDVGFLDKYIMYGSDNTATRRMTCDMVYNMFQWLRDSHCDDAGTLLTSQEEFEANAMGTIDVLFNNFAQGCDLRSFAWIVWSRGEFVGSSERYYPEDLPSFVGHNIMSLVMDSHTNATQEFTQKIFLKLFDMKVPLPDACPIWVEDTSRPLPSEDNDEPGKVRYVEILHLVTPVQYIVHMGWIHALKGLYERIPGKVKKDLSDGADQHIQKFRDLIKYWKDTSRGCHVVSDPITGESTDISVGSEYDAYHSNGDEILADMERFIQEITE